MTKKYSGRYSKKFWERVNAVKPAALRAIIYIAACALQDYENRVFQMLDAAEQRSQ